ncbi:hypothetical protein SASPL_157709 [Salvia splendens]|uniref:Cytochrome P450 n=1 Tax=Salvia splendens TaxID=180675 RepID=A0A8X8VUI1_SALSN|nr:hypothetical protein SASPL_157709 [Salvia splendens]
MFTARRLDGGKGVRREKVGRLVDYLRECRARGRAVDLGQAVFVTSFNLLSATFFSVDLIEFESDATQQLKETVEGRIKKRSEFYFGRLLGVLGGIIDERFESRYMERKNDLLAALFDLMEGSDEYDFNFKDIQHLFLDLFLGGSDTTQSTVEWAMTELLANPEKMSNAKNELKSVIGEKKQVEESHISRLPYLQALIKQTLRLHPPAPFLVPRQVDREISSLFHLGRGRRMCPGLPLADRMLSLLLGSILHNFEWEMEGGETSDTTEEFGLTLHKAVPLKAIPLCCL